MGLRALLTVAAQIAFPAVCAGCVRIGAPLLCDACAIEATPAPPRALEPFEACVAAYVHEGAPREALLAAKLGGERRGLPDLAARIPPPPRRIDVVTAVPDTYRTRAQRGGAIAGGLARAYARRHDLPYRELLRKRFATAEHGGASRAHRLADRGDAYAPRAPAPACVALVDDVVTTGATARACGEVLRAAGARTLVLVTWTSAVLRPSGPGNERPR